MQKYYGIELLRFFSAMEIMVYHYATSFFYLNLGKTYPFSSSLNLIYAYGNYAKKVNKKLVNNILFFI